MKITFQGADTGQTTHWQAVEAKEPTVRMIGGEAGYVLDIASKDADHQIYREQGKTAEEIMQDASRQNVDLTHNYMAVMSNSMSTEDFARLQEDGFEPGSTEVETAVTIVDEIKASLLAAGVSVTGYTDTVDLDTLTEITGDAGLAREMSRAFSKVGAPLTRETAQKAMQALEEAKMLRDPQGDTLTYMAANGKMPVIEDLYLAQYSSPVDSKGQGGGYYQDENGYLSRKADSLQLESLQPQIDKIVEQAGLSEVTGAREAASEMIESGLPLTAEGLAHYMELKKISLPAETETLLSAMATAVLDGREPARADLTGAKSLWQLAEEIWRRTQHLTGEAADLASAENDVLTLRSLESAQKLLDQGYENVSGENAAARRQLEEVRLQMTIYANRQLLKSGYAIETTQLEQVVEALRDVEENYNRILFGGEDGQESASRAQAYADTVDIVERLPQMPVAVLGKVPFQKAEFGLGEVDEAGKALQASYENANERYETFQTQVRPDMGDSIQKAFRNTQVLLEELGLEASDANKRAVRILGYNSLEITEESIQSVREADQALRNVARKLTPAATLEMIREGKNPLEMTVVELDDYLSERQQDPESGHQKFSKYLYKLEQKKEITEEEKESYIGIYRLLRQVEKSDGAVIGSLIHQGAALSFKNLLSAVRTRRRGGIDWRVDDDTGTLQEARKQATSIDSQIESAFHGGAAGEDGENQNTEYYNRLCHEAYARMDGDTVTQTGVVKSGESDHSRDGFSESASIDGELELEEFVSRLRQAREDEDLEGTYRREQIEQYRQSIPAGEEAEQFLQLLGEPLTLDNMMAAGEYLREGGRAMSQVKKEAGKPSGEEKNGISSVGEKQARLEEAINRLTEKFDSREEAGENYHRLAETEQNILEEAIYETRGITSAHVRELGLLYKQISFTAKLADTQRYDIPVIEGDTVMALHLQIVSSDENKGTVEASMDTERYGKLSIRLQIQDGTVRGLCIGSQQKAGRELEVLKENLKEGLSLAGFQAEGLASGTRKDLKTGFSYGQSQKEAGSGVSTRELYRVAKVVIITVHRQMERR